MNAYSYIIVGLLTIMFLMLFSRSEKVKTDFVNEKQYFDYIMKNKNKYIYIQPVTRKYFFGEKYPIIKRGNTKRLYLNVNDYIKVINFVDVLILLSEKFDITLYTKVSEKFSYTLRDITFNDVQSWDIKKENFYKYIVKSTENISGEIIENKNLESKNLVLDFLIIDDYKKFLNDNKFESITIFNLQSEISLEDCESKIIKLTNCNNFKIENFKTQQLVFSNCVLDTVDYDVSKIDIFKSIVNEEDFNESSNYNVTISNINEYENLKHYPNINLDFKIINEFELLEIGSKITIDEKQYYINSYFKYNDKMFYYYTARNIKSNEIIYFNPLTLGEDYKKNIKKNNDLLYYYNKYLPERNRSDTYSNRVEKCTMSFKLENYPTNLDKYLKYLDLINIENVNEQKIETLNTIFEIENIVLNQIDSLEQIVEFYENCFSPKLLKNRLEFILIPTKSKLIFYDKEYIYKSESTVEKIKFIIDKYNEIKL